MMDFLFFVKTFALTIVVVLLMQLQVGEKSIEHHAMAFMQSSAVIQPLNGVAKGAAKLARDVTQTISAKIKKNTKKEKRIEETASTN
jgi:uncharacterized metal-binding protein